MAKLACERNLFRKTGSGPGCEHEMKSLMILNDWVIKCQMKLNLNKMQNNAHEE